MDGGTHSHDVASMLVKKGHEVLMITSSQNKKKLEHKVVDGIEVIWLDCKYRSTMSFSQRIKSFIVFMFMATRILIKTNCNLVFATSTPLSIGLPALLKNFFHQTPFIFEVRDLWPSIPIEMGIIKNKFLIKFLYLFEKIVYTRASKIFTISDGISELINAPKHKVRTFPFGCNIEKYSSVKNSDFFLNNNFKEKIIVGLVGAIGYANDPFVILDCAEILLKMNNKTIQFVFFGEGSAKKEVVRKIKERSIKNVSVFESVTKSEALSLTKSLDCGLILHGKKPTYRYTASPNKFFDYLYFGTHIIYNFNGPLKNLLDEKNIGFYFNPNDPRKLAIYLNQLNIKSLEKQKTKSRDLAENNFNMDRILNEMYLEIKKFEAL